MNVVHVKEIAGQGVAEIASQTPGFHGASLSGSVNRMIGSAAFSFTSDIDLRIVVEGRDVDGADPLQFIWKFKSKDQCSDLVDAYTKSCMRLLGGKIS